MLLFKIFPLGIFPKFEDIVTELKMNLYSNFVIPKIEQYMSFASLNAQKIWGQGELSNSITFFEK